jgi:lysophospholipase L1-like esterase
MKFSLFFSIFASPWGNVPLFASNPHTQHLPVSHAAIISNGVNLRILPLGDSITYGVGSSDGNGYRLALQNMLSGNNVQYVGSQHSGSMANNSNEGHSGAVISQIAKFAYLSLKQLPNVILLMAGTNDMNIPTDPNTASDRLGSLIDELVIAVPDAVILVAQLIPSTTKSTETNIENFNAAVEGIVAVRANAKKKVLLVDMSKAVTTSDLADGLHPNDEGYIKMAATWYNAIQQASLNGWISPPQAVSTISSRTTCPGPVQWISRGLVAGGVGGGDTLELFFADINGDGKSDYLVLDAKGETKAWFNGGLDTDGSSISVSAHLLTFCCAICKCSY